MRPVKTRIGKILLSALFFLSVSNQLKAQTTLVAGDIAFSGYIANAAVPDQFSFVLMVAVTNNTVIKFTDFGWRTGTNSFNSGAALESELTLTVTNPAGLPAGSEIIIDGTTATLAAGGSAGTLVHSTGAIFNPVLSFATSGDQIFAYQNTFASPTFIAGIHMNVEAAPATTAGTWDGPGAAITGQTSEKPVGLTTGTNALWFPAENDNARFNCGPDVSTAALARAALNNPANWTANSTNPPGFTLPTGCTYLGAVIPPPVVTLDPLASSICQNANTSFTVAASNATTYQWQVSTDGGVVYNNVVNGGVYTNATTTTLNLTAVPTSFNNYRYRAVVTGPGGTVNSAAAILTVTPLPVNPTLLLKTPAASTVADGTPVSATFNAGSGGTGCADDFRYTTNGGASYLPYTPGTNIVTTGLAGGTVTIEGRRAGCSSSCQNSYIALATWVVTPLPGAATTLNAGDIAFSAYTSTSTDEFSFVLLRSIGSGTVINFTNNGWLSTNVFGVGEETATWTSNAAYGAGTEIRISGLTATLASGGSAGTVTGAALNFATSGDQVLAYRGTAASPTFISGIHMNVEAGSTAAAWDGTTISPNASALPTGLTTGVNAIWIGTAGNLSSEFDNSHYGNCAGPGTLGPINTLRAALNNQANWISNNLTPPGFPVPTGCSYLGLGTPPNISVDPANATVCQGVTATFTATISGATSYQWQVDNGGGFVNVVNNATYSGATTPTLTITATPLSFNTYQYRIIASNGSGSTTSAAATLTVNVVPTAPTLAAKIPAANNVADGTNVSATFTAGSGGTGCSDDYRYTVDGGTTYLPYTPGTNISTTGLAAGSGWVFIEGRRANCSAGCQGQYVVLASWHVTPLPVAATTLNAGDIAFSAYASTSTPDAFSFVLLRNIGPGTIINFTDNGWQAGALTSAEQTVTWTSPAAMTAGTEITIAGLTATRPGGGAAGTVTGTALSLTPSGDQILAYRGTAASPTFLTGIHMNLYTTLLGDPVSTTAAAWDGSATGQSASALPPGLTTGANAIWIGTQDVDASNFDNSRYGNCSGPGVLGPLTGLRAALNNQANWISDNNTPPSFTQPTGCNYLSVLCPTITVTNPANTAGTVNVAFSETFTSTGGTPTVTYSTASTLPTGLTLSAAGVLSGTPSQGGTFPIVVVATDGAGCTGTGATYNLVISCPAAVLGTATPASQTICSGATITTIVLAGVPGAVYNWTRDNNVPVTGIAASGAGDISGALTNTTNAPVTVTFTITPVTFGTCNQTPYTATVLVNPTPDAVATPSSQTICSGATITTIVLTGAVSGTVFNWTRDNTVDVTGIAASGAGDISGALTNTTNAPVTVTFTITPTANSCPGAAITATVVVNPTPNATATPSSQSRCSGQAITPIIMGGAVSGTSFNWTRDNFPTIGGSIPASGSGNISGTLVNNTGSPVTVTFTITPTANSCPGAAITATVTVNPLPTASITGGGNVAVCEDSNPVLTAGFDPNYTYAWGRSLFVAPFTPIGTAQTQPITASGHYLLTVTNQYGCTDTAMTIAHVADYVFNGSIGAGDAVQVGRLNRFAVVSTCASPKACPGLFTTVGNRFYDSYTITNPRNVPVCATIGLTSFCGTNVMTALYSGSYNPASQCTNYLADPGSSPTTSIFYEATIPANSSVVLVINEVNTGTGCANYRLTVDVPRETGITVTPTPPLCSGTPVTITAPAANSYSWTPGGATTQTINVTPPTGNTTYSVVLGYGNVGCTATEDTTINVGTLPDVTAVSDKYLCANTTAGPIAFTGSVPGTAYNWTNTNTAIGVGASGTGDIPSFTATNATAAPISGTITVTPVNGSCTGTPIIFTITVSPEAMITSVTDDEVCEPGGVVNLAAAGTGNINWYDALTGGIVVNSGNTYSPNISNTTTYYVESLVPPAAPATTLTMPPQSNTFPGNVRGYWFTAPTDFVITSLSVPTTASSAGQSIAVVRFNGNTPPPVFSATTNAFTTLFLTRNNTGSASIPCNIPVAAGEVIGLLGYRGNINSYAPGDYNTTIAGFPVQLQRLGMQFQLTNTDPRDIWREFGPATSISRIEFQYSVSQSCISAPRVPVTGTVIPTPVATATPASQTVCSGPITTIVLSSNVPGTTFAWTRDNTVDVTGIANSGTGDISGSLTNNTTVPQTVTFTITPTSPAGCVGAQITATVTMQAIPTITCPANITVNNNPGQCGNIVTYTPVSVTGIPVPTLTYDFTGATTGSGNGDGSGSFFNVGTTNVTLTATNICGSASCTFTVTVNDNEQPVVTCPVPVTVSCASDVPAVNTALVTYTDNCAGPFTVTHQGDVISNQTCLNRYIVTRTYRVTDGAGNFAECTQIITVDDQTAPTVTCPAPITVSCTNAIPAADIALVSASDNCAGAITITWMGDVITNQTCDNRYTLTRTYRATDVCGNFAECTQIITVNDQTPPVLTCPADITVSCTSAVPAPDVASVTGVSDNCGGVVTVTYMGVVLSNQTCANRYTLTRTYRATDVCGNFTECTQVITVNDQTAPVLTCPADITVSCAIAVPAPNIASVTGVSDNCGGIVTVTHQGDVISNQTCANRYTITRTYRATDACGNFAECTQIITVNDITAPTITCPANITVSCANAVPAPNTGSVSAVTDNCGGAVTVTHQGDVISAQTCANRYTITRTYRATDACGNFAECTQTIIVNDQTAPVLNCPAPVTVSCASAVPAADIASVTGVSDNCGGTVTVAHMGDVISAQTCANRYTITRTYRATDACGNFAECTQIISVNDQTPPVLTCPANVTVSCAAAVPAASIASVTGVSDNCGGVVTVTHIGDVISAQTCANRYTITRTYRATDVCGNFAECTQIITVNDQTPPVLTCPANTTVSCAAAVPAANIALVTGVSDNCAGAVTVIHVGDVISNQSCANRYTIIRTYRATDICGNFAECTQIITVNDQTAPVMTCPSNITVTAPAGTCVAAVSFTVTATDNCAGGVIIGSSPASGSLFPVGTTTVVSTASDICGNISTCTFTVTVVPALVMSITTQPANTTVCSGTNASFSVTAVNAVSYQWQRFNGTSWEDLNNATAATLTLNNVTVSMNNGLYRVVVTGLCTSVISGTATLFVNPLPTVALNGSPLIPILLPNQTTNLVATVSPTGGTFVWFKNNVVIPGAVTSTLTNIGVDDAGLYKFTYTGPNGCSSTSNQIVVGPEPSPFLFVYPNPNKGQFTVRFYNKPNEKVTLSVYDFKGALVYKKEFTTTLVYTQMNVVLPSAHGAGIYIVEVVNSLNIKAGSKRVLVTN